MAPTFVAALSFFLASTLAPVAGDAVSAPMSVEEVEALAADDECDATAPEGHCALSAAQLRAQVREHRSAADETPDDSGADESPEGLALLGKRLFTGECFAYTGQACLTGTCDAGLNAQCSYAKCVCSDDACGGADGKCYEQKNRLVAKGFYLNNGKYGNYKMYMQRISAFDQIKTTNLWSNLNMEQDLFDLYELPGLTKEGEKRYFLSSSKWPQSVVGFKATTGTAFSPFAAYAVDLGGKVSVVASWGLSNIMLKICAMGPRSSYPGALQVGAVMGGKTVWAYVHQGSDFVYASLTNPGEGGYWIPDPPLPANVQLPLCSDAP